MTQRSVFRRFRRSAAIFGSVIVLCGLLPSCVSSSGDLSVAIQKQFRHVGQSVIPSIVLIDVVETIVDKDQTQRPFFDYFFSDPNGQAVPKSYQQESLGSGVIVKKDGDKYYVLTNAHVVSEAKELSITLDDGRQFTAQVLGKDEKFDLGVAVFTTGDSDIVVATLGNSDELQVGDSVFAIGSPYGFQSSLTYGIVSALHRRGGPHENINDFIQTDASINKGNSGGALVNIKGEIVGINTWISSQSGDSVGLGFSIPINNAKKVISDFIAFGVYRYSWIGLCVGSLDYDQAALMKDAKKRGAIVYSVYEDSPAAKAGILPGDIIHSLDGRAVNTMEDIIQIGGSLAPAKPTTVVLERKGASLKVTLSPELRKDDDSLATDSFTLWPGLSPYPLTDTVRKELSLGPEVRGLLVRQVIQDSPAFVCGIRSRDIIQSVDGVDITELSQLYEILQNHKDDSVTVSVLRNNESLDLIFTKNRN